MTTNSWQLMSILMEQREMLGYLRSHLLGIFQKFPPSGPLPGTQTVLPYVILGDEAFMLKTTLMRPYPNDQTRPDTVPTLSC